MRKTSKTDPRVELLDTVGVIDPVYIGANTPPNYFIHYVEGILMFCHGWQSAEIWSREAAEELIYRNQLRNCFLVPVNQAC